MNKEDNIANRMAAPLAESAAVMPDLLARAAQAYRKHESQDHLEMAARITVRIKKITALSAPKRINPQI